MVACLFIFLGGGLGALSRYGVVCLLKPDLGEGRFPYDILTCNLLGCFLIGLIFAWQQENSPEWLSPLLVTGFLGGFTTFSSFGLEAFKLYDSGALLNAAIYILVTLIGCLLMVFSAIKIIR